MGNTKLDIFGIYLLDISIYGYIVCIWILKSLILESIDLTSVDFRVSFTIEPNRYLLLICYHKLFGILRHLSEKIYRNCMSVVGVLILYYKNR